MGSTYHALNRWLMDIRVTEWQKDGKRKQGRQRTKWRDVIGSFAGVTLDLDRWTIE